MNSNTGQMSTFSSVSEALSKGFDIPLSEAQAGAMSKLTEKERVEVVNAIRAASGSVRTMPTDFKRHFKKRKR